MSHSGLSAEQKSFLEECEIEFSTRYTADDQNYREICENGIPQPPVMIPWHGRQKLVARRGYNRYGNRYNDYNNQYRDQRDDRDRYYSRNPHNDRRDKRHNRY